MTSGISGPRYFGSSKSVALGQSLASRLHQQMPCNGGMLWRLTWKTRNTPALRSICLLRASKRSTLGNGCSGWPTPLVQDTKHHPRNGENTLERGSQMQLTHAAGLVSFWPTPKKSDGDRGGFSKTSVNGFEGRDKSVWSQGKHGHLPRSPVSPSTTGPWSEVEWLPCIDGKFRPTKPGIFPLSDGVPNRVGALRGAGNAIVPQVATEFIKAYLASS